MATWVVLEIASPAEAEYLVRDVREYPQEALLAPHYGDHVHCTVAGVYDHLVGDLKVSS